MSSNKPNVMNFAQALRMKPGNKRPALAESAGAAESEPPANFGAPAKSGAPPKKAPEPLQNEPAPKSAGAPKFAAPAESVPAAEGPHTRVPNEIFETIMPTLKPGAQVVLWRLYRLSAGFNNSTCHVSVPKLAEKTHIGETQVREFLRYLEERGWIRRVAVDLHNKNQRERGITFEVKLPRLAPPKSGGAPKSGAGPNSEPNKYKDLKERDIKGESASPDLKNCPDCQGSGFWYPEGTEKGVAKCRHERMAK